MHHLYPLAKGDPLCPLGFHPQVRWPTRCKRCFRDYKEHGGRKKEDDFAASTPSLSNWSSPAARGRDGENGEKTGRGWASSTNLSAIESQKKDNISKGLGRTSASWTSTPDLGATDENAVTVSLRLPKKRLTGPLPSLDTGQNTETSPATVTLRRPSPSPPPSASVTPAHLTITKSDSLAERVRKMQLLKAQNSFEKESSIEKERERERRSVSKSKEEEKEKVARSKEENRSTTKDDVKFLMQIKNSRVSSSPSSKTKPPLRGGPPRDKDDASDDELSTADTETTLVDPNVKEYQDHIENLKDEVDILKKRCERVEKEKSDILLRRLANIDTVNKYTSGRSSELLKLQQKVNELTTQNEDLRDEKKSLSLKVKEMESELETKPSIEVQTRQIEQLRAKLLAAETLCEELMDENEDMKKELRDLEEEIEEMQDNFREDQADEYSSLRRELEQTIKNCRVLSFKLKKTERRSEQLEQEKADQEKKLLEIVGGQEGLDRVNRIKELEQEVSRSTEVALRLQRELAEANTKLAVGSGNAPANQKRSHTDGQKVSRASLTRGGSQDDPAQLLRDLQDSLEREADLREQLKNAEEEANNLRKTASRVEDDNESLFLQLRKMATKARSRKLSPTPPTNRLAIEAPNEKDEGISDEEDPAELRILLELNEQEAAVLRRKVEELEQDRDSLKRQVKELTDKISSTPLKANSTLIGGLRKNSAMKTNNLADEKVKVLEDEISELRKKLIEKERDCERLHAELSLVKKKTKGSLIKSKSLDGASEQQNVDLKRQLQVIEQEASVLRSKTQSLEADNEKLHAENKKLQLLKNTKSLRTEKSLELNIGKISKLEKELKDALSKIKEFESNREQEEKPLEKKVRFGDMGKKDNLDTLKSKQDELEKLKSNFSKLEKENVNLKSLLKSLRDDAIKSFKPRTAKKLTDLTTKLQMKKMVEELENEIGDMYVVMKNAGISSNNKTEQSQLDKDLSDLKLKFSKAEVAYTNDKEKLQSEINNLKDLNIKLEKDKATNIEKYKIIESDKTAAFKETNSMKEQNIKLEYQISKLNMDIKNFQNQQLSLSDNVKKIEDFKKEIDSKDKEVEKLKKQIEQLNKVEQDKNKLLKEVGDKAKKIGELEKNIKEAEEKYKRVEKQLNLKKDRVNKLEKELSEEQEQTAALSTSHRRMSVEFITEKDEMHTKLIKTESKLITLEIDMKNFKLDNENKITTLESTIAAKDIHIKQLEDALRETSNQKYDEAISPVEMAHIQEKLGKTMEQLEEKDKELITVKLELTKTEKFVNDLQTELSTLKVDISKWKFEKKDLENKLSSQKKDSTYWESKASEFETDLQAERKKIERMRISHDKDNKNKEAELATLKGKLKILEQSSGAGNKKIADLKQEHEESIKRLEHSLAVEKAEYEELTGKYEILEEEHVVTKARLTVEKEAAQSGASLANKELNSALTELKTLKESIEEQSAKWEKEKSALQSEISSLQERLCGGGWEVERARLIAKLDQRERDLKAANDQRSVITHQNEITKKELEEIRKKLEDYEKVSKVHRNLTSENAELERELSSLHKRLEQADQARRNEINDTKMRYEDQMKSIRDELKSLQTQVSRLQRERDNYKQMLDAADKIMAKSGDKSQKNKRASISSADEDEYRSRVAILEQQVTCLEDDLCESRLLASKLNTELISERSSAEVRHAEMQSRLNEYEEERLLTSGRARVAGLATRMELAWHKERDEQQRLLQETSTLARDLRQTLFEVERERDKERLDMKRRIDQLKKTTEEETEEAKKKVTELQCDLLELRDAHAKLRTTNEKLRRDKERHDREREQNKLLIVSLKRTQQEDDRKTTQLLETIDDLMKQSPDLFNKEPVKPEKMLMTPTPPRRNRSSKSRSREATPESASEATAATVSRLRKLADELRASRIAERQRRQQASARRAASTEPRDTLTVTPTSRTPSRAPSLKKRSVSLEQTTKEQGSIWKSVDEGSISSIQSLDGEADIRLFSMQRDTSLDSRLSGGSAQSDVLPASEKKKKKGLFGKLKKLTKSRSIDDNVNPEVVEFRPIGTVSQGSDSDMSGAGSKRDLRGRLSDMFHRKGTLSRGNSKEETPERPASVAAFSRPIIRNSSAATLPPTKSSNEINNMRAASTTPATKRKGK